MVDMGKLSAAFCVPFGAETVESDPCAVGTARNYTAGLGANYGEIKMFRTVISDVTGFSCFGP